MRKHHRIRPKRCYFQRILGACSLVWCITDYYVKLEMSCQLSPNQLKFRNVHGSSNSRYLIY